MIGVYLQGRLGNQMFQYAFAFNTSKKLNTDFFLDEKYYALLLKDFFDLKSYNSSFASKIQRIKFKFKKHPVIDIDHSKPYIENQGLTTHNDCFYKGFFQSEFYFQEFGHLLREEFLIKKDHQIDVRQFLKLENNKPLVVLHVRRTDYLTYGDESMGGKDLSLPIAYYKACLSKIADLENYNVVFVTDDTAFVKTNFGQYGPVISSNKNPIVDFQILLAADILVVANSSFSWWGGYLSTQCKRIFVPKYWLGFIIKKEYPSNIIPEQWEQIEFE